MTDPPDLAQVVLNQNDTWSSLRVTETQVREAQRLYESGESLRQIGFKVGFNDKTIKKALIDAGVEVHDQHRGI